MLRLTPVVRNLIIINVVVFVVGLLISQAGLRFKGQEVEDLARVGGLYSFTSAYFYPWQVFTYMFLHGGYLHLIFNMLGLFFLGPLLENVWGGRRFLFYYLVVGLGVAFVYNGVKHVEEQYVLNKAQAFYAEPTPLNLRKFIDAHPWGDIMDKQASIRELRELWAQDYEDVIVTSSVREMVFEFSHTQGSIPMVGASGAIYGLIIAFGLLFPNTEFFLLFLPIPIKAKYMAIGLAVFAFFSAVNPTAGDNVAHYAHLAGMLVGLIVLLVWKRNRKSFY